MQVRDLMTHTSGLTYDFLEDFPVGAQYRDARLISDPTPSLGAMIAELARIPLAFQPGAMWHYSLGTDVAAHLIEVISGKPLGQFLHERLFEPLGMLDTAFGVPPAERHRLQHAAAISIMMELLRAPISAFCLAIGRRRSFAATLTMMDW